MFCAGTLTVGKLLALHARLRGSAQAMSSFDLPNPLSYTDLDRETRGFAELLDRIGVGEAEGIIILADNGAAFTLSMLGAMRSGRVAIPVPTSSTVHELGYFVEHSGSRVIVTSQAYLETARAAAPHAAIILREPDGLWSIPSEIRGERRPIAEEGAGLVLYTSGSTARPKGVVFSHEAVISAGLCNAWHQQLRPDDHHGITLPMYHSNALFLQFWAALSVGASVYFSGRFDAVTYWRDMTENGVTVANLVAGGIRALLTNGTPNGHGLRFMLYGLALDAAEMERFETDFRSPLVMVYGLTETAACGTRSPISLDRKADRIGLPMPGWEIRILDDNLQPVGTGVPGQVWLRGPSMFSGYLGQGAETGAVLHEGGLLTGDVAEFDEDGFVIFIDRMKDLIKVNGRSVSPLEIEAVLRAYPGVIDVAAIGVPDERTDERAIAYVVAGAEVSAERLLERCREHLSFYKVPREIVLTESLPKTSVGKTRKSELLQTYRKSREVLG